MDEETLEILAGLNAAQPLTQQVDYSQFMNDFQPVLNDPNYFVPQQGLLQNTPVLDTLSDLDVMQQRPQVVTNMLDQYPTLESDFQRSFAVSPDTFNMNVYQPLPYDANYFGSLVGGDGTIDTSINAADLIGAGLLGKAAIDAVKGDDGTTTTETDSTNLTTNDVVSPITTISTGVENPNVNKVIKVSDEILPEDTIDIEIGDNITSKDTGIISTISDGTTNLTPSVDITDADDATKLRELADAGFTSNESLDILNAFNTGVLSADAFANALKTGVVTLQGDILTGVRPDTSGLTVTTGNNVSDNIKPTLTNTSDVTQIDQSLGNRVQGGLSDFFNTELTSGIGEAGTYLKDVTNVTVGEALSGIGGLLSLADMVDDANVGNTLGTAAGLSGFGLFGDAAQGIAPALGAGALIASLAGLGQPDPSNEAGFAQVDTNSNNVTPFGMEGDKFNQENVNQSTSIANAMNNVVNNITGNYGLKTEGDILVQTGERDPLSVTFGDMSEEPTINNRLNYNTKEGDILNTTDDVSRFYYTGQVGNDGSALVDNIVKGTNLLSLKAVANDEDTINMKDFRVPAFSADKVKNQYLDMGLDETSANALTNAARSESAATSELLGSLLVANTTNEDLFLTDAEKTSLLEKGYTEEQLDAILYG